MFKEGAFWKPQFCRPPSAAPAAGNLPPAAPLAAAAEEGDIGWGGTVPACNTRDSVRSGKHVAVSRHNECGAFATHMSELLLKL